MNFNIQKDLVSLPDYKDVKNFFKDTETVSESELREAIIQIRNGKFPNILEVPNCGSFFKNPIVSRNQLEKIQKVFPEIPVFSASGMKTTADTQDDNFKIPVAYVLEKLGFKGAKEGSFNFYEKHALILTNTNNGSVTEFLNFIRKVKSEVYESIGIKISEEVNII